MPPSYHQTEYHQLPTKPGNLPKSGLYRALAAEHGPKVPHPEPPAEDWNPKIRNLFYMSQVGLMLMNNVAPSTGMYRNGMIRMEQDFRSLKVRYVSAKMGKFVLAKLEQEIALHKLKSHNLDHHPEDTAGLFYIVFNMLMLNARTFATKQSVSFNVKSVSAPDSSLRTRCNFPNSQILLLGRVTTKCKTIYLGCSDSTCLYCASE